MTWFCYQKSPTGRRVAVLFDEKPNREWDMCSGVDFSTVREVPAELEGASLAEVVAWSESRVPVPDLPLVVSNPRPDRETELLEANNREVERRRQAEAARDCAAIVERNRIAERIRAIRIVRLQAGVDPLTEINDVLTDLAECIETDWADFEE
jgi:hypothetical protein